MLNALIAVFRESLEAMLVIGVLIAYAAVRAVRLRQLGRDSKTVAR
jgi:hypothetical protein